MNKEKYLKTIDELSSSHEKQGYRKAIIDLSRYCTENNNSWELVKYLCDSYEKRYKE